MSTLTDTIHNLAITSDRADLLAAREELALLAANTPAVVEATDGTAIRITDASGDAITAGAAIAEIDTHLA